MSTHNVTRAPNALGVVTLAFAGPSLPAVSNWRAQHQLAVLRWLPNMEIGAVARQSWAA
jgi:hypothetical protein